MTLRDFDDDADATVIDPSTHWSALLIQAVGQDYIMFRGRRPLWIEVLDAHSSDPNFLLSCDSLGFDAPQIYYEQWDYMQRLKFPRAIALLDSWGILR